MKWAPTLVLILFPLLFLGKAVFTSQTIGAFDWIAAMSPWNRPAPAEPWDVLQADSVLQFYVWRDLVLTSWGQYSVPSWNPYALGGTPLLENSQSAAMYPPHIVLGILKVPAGHAIDFLAWFHLAIAGLGVARLTRSLGGCSLGGVFAGLVMQSTPFLIRWTSLASVPTTVCWIPWAMAGSIELAKLPSHTSGRERVGSASFLMTVIAVAMMLLGGHLQFAAYGLGGTLFCLVWMALQRHEAARPQPMPRVLTGGLAMSLGLLVSMVQLLPVLDYSKFSHRRNSPSEDGYKAYVGLALPPAEIVQRLGLPMSQGNPTVSVEGTPASTYWPAVTKPGANYAESATTIGIVALAPLALLIFRRRLLLRTRPMLGLAVIGLVLASGSDFNRLLYFGVPGWSSTGSPGRILILALIGLATASGLAVASLLEETANKKEIAIGALFALVPGLTLVAASQQQVPGNFLTEDAMRAITVESATHVVLGMILCAALVYCASRPAWRLPSLIAIPLIWALGTRTFSLVPVGDASVLHSVKAQGDTHDRTAFDNTNWSFVGIPKAVFPPNTPSLVRARDLGGYDSLLHRETVEMLKKVNGSDPAPPANGNMMFIKPNSDEQALSEAGVSWRVVGLEHVLAQQGKRLSPNAEWISESMNTMSIKVLEGTRVSVKERNIEGWQAKADGKTVDIKGNPWIEVDVPSGTQTLELSYIPPRFTIGLISSAMGILLVSIFVVAGRRKRPEILGNLG